MELIGSMNVSGLADLDLHPLPTAPDTVPAPQSRPLNFSLDYRTSKLAVRH